MFSLFGIFSESTQAVKPKKLSNSELEVQWDALTVSNLATLMRDFQEYKRINGEEAPTGATVIAILPGSKYLFGRTNQPYAMAAIKIFEAANKEFPSSSPDQIKLRILKVLEEIRKIYFIYRSGDLSAHVEKCFNEIFLMPFVNTSSAEIDIPVFTANLKQLKRYGQKKGFLKPVEKKDDDVRLRQFGIESEILERMTVPDEVTIIHRSWPS